MRVAANLKVMPIHQNRLHSGCLRPLHVREELIAHVNGLLWLGAQSRECRLKDSHIGLLAADDARGSDRVQNPVQPHCPQLLRWIVGDVGDHADPVPGVPQLPDGWEHIRKEAKLVLHRLVALSDLLDHRQGASQAGFLKEDSLVVQVNFFPTLRCQQVNGDVHGG